MKDCPNVRSQGTVNVQTLPSGLSSEAPKSNRVYAPNAKPERDNSLDFLTGILHVLFNVYVSLYQGSTLSFVKPFLTMKFD